MRLKDLLFRFVLIVTLMFLLSLAVQAHHLEPISTEYALPFAPKAGAWEITYEFEREGRGANQQALPEVELEIGLFARLQFNLGFPLLRRKEGLGEPAPVVGGAGGSRHSLPSFRRRPAPLRRFAPGRGRSSDGFERDRRRCNRGWRRPPR